MVHRKIKTMAQTERVPDYSEDISIREDKDMGMMFGCISTNSNRRTIQIKNLDGSVAATISTSKPAQKSKKKLSYNFKAISSQILLSKTSGSASKAVTKARGTIAMLLRKVKTGEYDDQELEMAITHAKKMERIAKKRVRHLKQEEEIEQKGSSEEIEDAFMDEMEEQCEEEQDVLAMSEEELQKLLEEYEELMQESMEEMAQEMSLEELTEEFAAAAYDMSPEDLEQLRKKHRSDEMREIMDADMKYLRAMFNKLEKEKQAASGSSGNSGSTGSSGYQGAGVSLELSGLDMPVETAEVPVMAEGGSIDLTV